MGTGKSVEPWGSGPADICFIVDHSFCNALRLALSGLHVYSNKLVRDSKRGKEATRRVHTTRATVTPVPYRERTTGNTLDNPSVLRVSISRRYITPSSQAGGVGDICISRSLAGHSKRVTAVDGGKGTRRDIPRARAFAASILDTPCSGSSCFDTQANQSPGHRGIESHTRGIAVSSSYHPGRAAQ